MRWRRLWGDVSAQADGRFWILFILTAVLLLVNIPRGDLAGYDDAVYAHEGKLMLATGDWWNVWLNGKLDFDKPPLFIWLEAASFAVFGVSDAAAKFPSALLGLGTLVLVYAVARELTRDHWISALAMLVLATTQYFLKYAMHAMTDVPFAFLFTLAIWAYLKARQRPAWFLWCGVAIGAAGLTRSILGLLALGVVGAHLFVQRRDGHWRSVYGWLGLLLALGLPLGWFVAQYTWHGAAFVAHHFAYTAENVRSIPPQRDWHWLLGLGEYPFLLVKLVWPWWICLAGGLVLLLRRLRQGGGDERSGLSNEALWLLLLWLVVVIVPFSLITHKVLRYILPAFPALAILSALALRTWIPPRHLAKSFVAACLCFGLSVLVVCLTPSHKLRAAEIRPLAHLAAAATTSSQPILLYTRGQARWDYLHQIIWYTDRRGQLVPALEQARCWLAQPQATAIVDRLTYEQHFSDAQFEVLGQTDTLLCLRRRAVGLPLAARAETQPCNEKTLSEGNQ